MVNKEWIECKLADACRSIDYGYTASANDAPVGPRFLRITDIVSGHIDWTSVPHVQADVGTQEKYRLSDGDIVIARTGASTGASMYIKNPPDAIFASYLVRLKIKNEFNSRFIAYYLKSDTFWSYIRGVLGDKSAQPNASASTMTQAPLRIPKERKKQEEIAYILGALDDKIELNRKMNETLEAMARAIFKSSFTYPFEGIKYLQGEAPSPLPSPNGRGCQELTGEGELELVDSPLGKIPKGWRAGTLGEMCDIIMGQSPPGETYNETGEGMPFYQGIRDFGFRFPNRRVYCNSASRIAQKGDVLLSVRAPVGSLNIAGEECAIGRGVATLRIKGQHYGFLYYIMKETQWEWAKYEAEGTAFGSATKTDVQNFSIIVPPIEAISGFNKVVFPMDKTIKNNEMQSRTLAFIRDALLPKLLSGEIRVKDAERFVETV